jgi:hypothetical protein
MIKISEALQRDREGLTQFATQPRIEEKDIQRLNSARNLRHEKHFSIIMEEKAKSRELC